MSFRSIVHISSLPPSQCGVAEYTNALAEALKVVRPELEAHYVRLDSETEQLSLKGNQVTLNPLDTRQIALLGTHLNSLEKRAVLLQHEFKLYGAPDGENVIGFLEAIRPPIIATLHTVWPSFAADRMYVFKKILHKCDSVMVFSQLAGQILQENYAPKAKIHIVPHGIADVPLRLPHEVINTWLPGGPVTFATAGLMRATKGIEQVINALRSVRSKFDDFRYVICGADHPRNPGATEYRRRIQALIAEYGLEKHIVFVDRFLSHAELVAVIQSSHFGVLPYTSSEQSSSGILALFLACGRPVIATDFQYARATLSSGNGIVVEMNNIEALASAIESLLGNAAKRELMMRQSYTSTRSWRWPEVARMHVDIIDGHECR